jgi:hypothetical protein
LACFNKIWATPRRQVLVAAMLALPQSIKANTAFGSAAMASTIRSNFPSEAFCYLTVR